MVQAEGFSKHDQIIQYIEGLEVGTRISVRKLAQELDVSEGTAYRAMKDAENKGIVMTKERAGTVRINNAVPAEIDKLTFKEIANIVDGRVMGGEAGLHKTLSKFVIGAMQLEAMIKYIEPGNLLIVGNREKAHHSALTLGAGVLITGGFEPGESVKALADELELPVISSGYDTFTVATLINRAISDKLIRKQIVRTGDLVPPGQNVAYVHQHDTIEHLLAKIAESNHNRFPVVNDEHKPVGMITTKDIIGAQNDEPLSRYMTPNPVTVTEHTSVASAGYMMVWDSLELLPIVNQSGELIHVISRKDVLKSMQDMQLQPHYTETLEDQIWTSFKEMRDEDGQIYYQGQTTAQMTNALGSLSHGVLSGLINQVSTKFISALKKGDMLVDSTSIHYFIPVELESRIVLYPNMIESSRRFCKVMVEVFKDSRDGHRVAQAMVTARLM